MDTALTPHPSLLPIRPSPSTLGNYFNLLKEVAFSPQMGAFLTYKGSASYYFNREIWKKDVYPDENFAREIQQLFTIGLWRLNPDGTQMLDSNMAPIPAHGNKDIMSFAKIWTGWWSQVHHMQSRSHAVTQSRSHAVTQPRSHAVTQPRSHAATQSRSHAVTHLVCQPACITLPHAPVLTAPLTPPPSPPP